MSDPIKDLREALGEIRKSPGTYRNRQLAIRAEAALTELEADWQVLVEAIGHNAVCSCPKEWVGEGVAPAPKCRRCKAADLILKPHLAAAKSTTAEEEK